MGLKFIDKEMQEDFDKIPPEVKQKYREEWEKRLKKILPVKLWVKFQKLYSKNYV